MEANKIKGMIYGVALGDAIGAPYEFKKNKEKFNNYTGIIDKKIIHNNRWQGSKSSALGQITDDTEMTLALANSIIRKKYYDTNDVILSYIKWANSDNVFMGNNTRDLFKGIKTIAGYSKRYNYKVSSIPKEKWTQSNGCLMRASPLALLRKEDYLADAILDCTLTNPHPICVDAVSVYVTLLRNIIEGKTINKAIKNATLIAKTKQVKRIIKDGINRKERDIEINKGWVLHSLYCVFYSLAGKHKTYEDGINEIIKMGGDTDTNGCIVGAILGAHFGFNKINKEKLTSKNISIIINCDTKDGDIKRDDFYTLKNIDTIIKKLTNIYEKN